jgi:two-component system chemotaxis sensor kinase CheA
VTGTFTPPDTQEAETNRWSASLLAERDEALARLQTLGQSVDAMLGTLDQGIFSFGPDGICLPLYSKACLKLIEAEPAGKTLSDVLKLPASEAETVEPLLGIIFDRAKAPAFIDDYLSLLPMEFKHSGGLKIWLSYRPVFSPERAIQSILVIATDHTIDFEAEAQRRIRDQAARRILRISGNRNLFTRFYLSASIFFSAAIETLSDHIPLANIKRDIHTLKGNASIFYLAEFATRLHNVETALENTDSMAEVRGILTANVPAVRLALLGLREEASKIFGEEFDRQGSMRTIPLDLLRSFAVDMKNGGSSPALAARFVTHLMGEPIRKQLYAFDISLQELADRYGRAVAPCIVMGENFQILTENYEPFFSSLMHLARNIIAHAIDDEAARRKWAKSPRLTVTFDTQRFERNGQDWFRLTITDDGRGIDTIRMRQRLKQSHDAAVVDLLSEDDIVQYIFHDNLTTTDVTDELSGRGLGMSAINKEVMALGGEMRADSELNRFTRITIDLPLIWN